MENAEEGEKVRPLRKDAERSRQRVIVAASQVYATRGLEAGFDEIARVAGVGVGTVYRRFPVKDDLIDAVLDSKFDRMVAVACEALQRDNTWETLVWFLEQLICEQSRDLGLAQVIATSEALSGCLATRRAELVSSIDAVTSRAQRGGVTRSDLVPLDFAILTTLITKVAAVDDAQLWRRYFTLVLDILKPGTHADLAVGPVPTEAAVERLLGAL